MRTVKVALVLFVLCSVYAIYKISSMSSDPKVSENNYNDLPRTTSKSVSKPAEIVSNSKSVVNNPNPQETQAQFKANSENPPVMKHQVVTCVANIQNCISCLKGNGESVDCRTLEFEKNRNRIDQLRGWPDFYEYLSKTNNSQSPEYLSHLTNSQMLDLLRNFSVQYSTDYDELLRSLGLANELPPDIVECKVPDKKFCFEQGASNE